MSKPGLVSGSIKTFTGKHFTPLDPKTEDIDPIDIAHALSNQCRYTGHTNKFYSVAEHSVLMHDYAMGAGIEDEDILKWFLLHDGDEAYMLDLAAPIKHHPNGFGDAFKEAASVLHEKIAERFDLPLPEPAIIKEVDIKLRAKEIQVLFNTDGYYDWGEPLPVKIFNWVPTEAKYQMIWRMQYYGIVKRNSTGEFMAA